MRPPLRKQAGHLVDLSLVGEADTPRAPRPARGGRGL